MSPKEELGPEQPEAFNEKGRDNIWTRYIKNIPEDSYFLTPSCILGVYYPSTEAMIPRLFDLLDLDWGTNLSPEAMCTCCTGIAYHGDVMTIEGTLLTVARIWSVAQEAGYDTIATTCVTSFGIHSECFDLYHEEPGLKKKMDKLLMKACGRKFELPKYIVHASDIVYKHRERIRDDLLRYRLVNKSSGRPLRVVDHVGCHYNKLFPEERSLGGSEYCEVLSGTIKAWGGKEIDYPERRHCCGMGFRQIMITPNRSFSAACTNKKLASMEPFEPDLIVTNCPGCEVTLDKEQWPIKELNGKEYFIPVLTYMELAGLLAGWDPYDIVGIQFHTVPVEPLLDKLGIPYDESRAWLGKDGQTLTCSDEIRRATPDAGEAHRGEIIF
jgi:heterodisulfide reductase subunit B